MSWYLANKRDLPWRKTQDPYLIWLSEIILQQTRVAQGLPYFERFCQRFPTVFDLANASEQDVLNLWQGLGYYSRGRNLHKSAQMVVSEWDGKFPSDYASLLKLKGVGAYTAAAIASFSAGHKHAVVDGNVIRVLSRYFGIDIGADTLEGKRKIDKLADELIQDVDPTMYNQSIMEFGALMCKPSNPDCSICPLASSCWALQHNRVAELPIKEKKIKKKERYFDYFIIEYNGGIFLKERLAGDIWQGLFDLPMLERVSAQDSFSSATDLPDLNIQAEFIADRKHLLTHQKLNIRFFKVHQYNRTFIENKSHKWVPIEQLDNYPKPIVIQNFLNKFFSY